MVKGIISGIEFPGCLQVQPFIEEVIELPLIPALTLFGFDDISTFAS